MSIARRDFLRNFGLLAALSTLISSTDAQDLLFSPTGNDPFAFKVSVKYYPPVAKDHALIRKEIKSWGNEEKYNLEISRLEGQGFVSKEWSYVEHENFHEFKMAFKDRECFENYCKMIKENEIVNHDLQNQLGYRIVCDIA